MADQNFRVKRGLEVGVGGTIITAKSTGNVGISSAEPTAKLDVGGDGRFIGVVTATSFSGSLIGTATTSNNLNRTVTAGSGLTGGGTLTSDVTLNVGAGSGISINADDVQLKNAGSLTGNRVTKWDSGNTQLTNSIITDDGTNIGINSTSPAFRLDVVGDIKVSGISSLGDNVYLPQGKSVFFGSSKFDILQNSSTQSLIRTQSGSNLFLAAGGYIDLVDTIGANRSARFTPGGAADLYYAATRKLSTTNTGVSLNSGRYEIDDISVLSATTLGSGVTNSSLTGLGTLTQLSVSGVSTFNSNVGIATTNPTSRLHVVGDGRFTGVVTATTFIGNLTGTVTTATTVSSDSDSNTRGGTGVGSSLVASSGTNNTFFGFSAGCRVTTGDYNIALGSLALLGSASGVTGSHNVAIGRCAGADLSSGACNNFLGYFAGHQLVSGSDNNFFGSAAGYANTSGNHNNFLGYYAGRANTTGSYNNFFGRHAGCVNTTGSNNVFFGQNAGCTNVSGSQNVVIGHNQNTPITSGSNQLVIGAGNTSWINGNSSYNVGLGTTNPTSKLHVVGDGRFTGVVTATTFYGEFAGISVGIGTTSSINTTGIITASSFVGNLTGTATTATTSNNLNRTVTAGSGLTGGGTLTSDVTLNVGAGDGISVAADSVAVDTTVVRTTRTITSGNGLTGGGDLSSDKTLAVGAGLGISVNADDVQLKNAGSLTNNYLPKWDSINTQLTNTNLTYVNTPGSGIGTLGIGTVISIKHNDTLNSGTLSFEGSAGQLFTITNNLTSGSIFSVNDSSGIPSIDVNADDTVLLAPYNGNVGVGTTIPGARLNVVDNSSSDALRITQTGTGKALVVEDETNPDATPFVITASGSVGIGISNPSSTLHLRRSSGELASFEVTSAASAYFSFTSQGTQFGYFGSASGFITTGTIVDLGLRSNNNILFSIGNAEKLRLNSSGTFLVGTASSTGTASQQLQVNSGGYFNGSVGIGTTNPTSKLHVVGDGYFTGIVTATDFNSASDAKLKTNIQPIEDPLNKVAQIQGVSFNWIENNKPSMGVIADEVEKILPELVSDTDPKTVNYNGLIGLLIEVVKEQQLKIESLEQRITKLE